MNGPDHTFDVRARRWLAREILGRRLTDQLTDAQITLLSVFEFRRHDFTESGEPFVVLPKPDHLARRTRLSGRQIAEAVEGLGRFGLISAERRDKRTVLVVHGIPRSVLDEPDTAAEP